MRRYDEQRGVVLVLVLWLLALLSLMAGAHSYALRTETWLTIHALDRARARAAAEAGVWLAVADLLSPPSAQRWPHDGTPIEVNFAAGTIGLRIQDEAGLIDINSADDALLQGLLSNAAQPGQDVVSLFDALLDWRDPDPDRRGGGGAEDGDYLHAPYESKDGPFNSIEELRRVAGMSDELYRNIRDAVTIHSMQAGINPALAPRAVLEAIPGSRVDLVDAYLAGRHEAGQTAIITGTEHHFFNAQRGLTLTVTSSGRVGRGNVRLDVVVALDSDRTPPYSVLSWRESRLPYTPPSTEGNG
ncbi:MAG: type II secretion system protein GspK [Gammaproteobacteria bacterium]|nr:type II secretion system protein GspK [Gammaproteobacteria bacterium]